MVEVYKLQDTASTGEQRPWSIPKTWDGFNVSLRELGLCLRNCCFASGCGTVEPVLLHDVRQDTSYALREVMRCERK